MSENKQPRSDVTQNRGHREQPTSGAKSTAERPRLSGDLRGRVDAEAERARRLDRDWERHCERRWGRPFGVHAERPGLADMVEADQRDLETRRQSAIFLAGLGHWDLESISRVERVPRRQGGAR